MSYMIGEGKHRTSWSKAASPCKGCGSQPEFDYQIRPGGYIEPFEELPEGGEYGPQLQMVISCPEVGEKCWRNACGVAYTDDIATDLQVKYKALEKLAAMLTDWWNRKQAGEV